MLKILNLELVVTSHDPGVTTDSFLETPAQCAVAATSGNTIQDIIRKKYWEQRTRYYFASIKPLFT